jgi:hypothetical protein
MPINYQLGKIYKITSGDLTYIGSTCEPTLAKRLAKHIACFKQWKKGNSHDVTSYRLIETGLYEITLVELCPCGSKDELTARERFHIENTVCVNKVIPGRTKKEYIIDTKEYKSEYDKSYRIDNIEIIKEKKKAYQEANKEVIAKKRNANYQTNKDIILEQQKIKFTCECGSICRIAGKAEHERSKKHLEFKVKGIVMKR